MFATSSTQKTYVWLCFGQKRKRVEMKAMAYMQNIKTHSINLNIIERIRQLLVVYFISTQMQQTEINEQTGSKG